MTTITDQELLRSIQDGFKRALKQTDRILRSEASLAGTGLLSAKFVYEVSNEVHESIEPRPPRGRCLRVIEVRDCGKKKSGEWLVDACITEERCHAETPPFIDRIVFAMESESNTGQRAFDHDFAKLVHLNADYKLYLNGLSQTTCQGMCNYITRRCEYVETILNRVRPLGEFYFGFWPSPAKPRNGSCQSVSIWKDLLCGKWGHLNKIRLWRFDKCSRKLIRIRPEGR
ncbi:MAG: hypothetical protein F4149_17840 [Gammaproteobacteria bacterium]|nr:hypothetical protein [Gammaproteobacteria bacterium]MYK83610.1 hypothetical protein [Gammaproteobacteria bacterium]